MKKQILFLALFIMALIAGTSNAFAQLSPGITATQPIDPLACVATSEPLHPFPGQAYTYEMDGVSGIEHANQWTWFATKNPAFINTTGLNMADRLTETPGQLLDVSANYGVATADANTVSITWSPEVLANTVYQGVAGEPTFVVGYATGENCADNIQVYEINPRPNFTVDIANIDTVTTTLAWDAETEQCVDIVRSATYNHTSHAIDMNYGKDILYFEVAAANFVTDFTPTFRLVSGLATTQTAVVTLHATLAAAQAGTGSLGTVTWTDASVGADWAVGTAFTATTPADAVTGVSLFVKVVITNDTEESLTPSPFVLAVDAIDNGGTGIWDMEDDDCTLLADAADQVDLATHTINPRPQLDHATEDAGAPDPTTLIIKTP